MSLATPAGFHRQQAMGGSSYQPKARESGKPRETSAEELISGFAGNLRINQNRGKPREPSAEDLILGFAQNERINQMA